MSVSDILNGLIYGDLPRSIEVFCPELLLCVTVISLLLLRLFSLDHKIPPYVIALGGTVLAFIAVLSQFVFFTAGGAMTNLGAIEGLFQVFQLTEAGAGTPGAIFTSLLMHDAFTLFFRLGLTFFLVLVVALTVLSGIPDSEDGPDFYTLLIGSTIGMMVATSANHLLMLFLGVEMMSVPSYVMVGFLKGRRSSSEAALKYVVYGAGTAGVMLYGISLIAGLLGTADFAELGPRLAYLISTDGVSLSNPNVVVTLLGIMMVLVGLAFKLSLVPFHFWCPDAFEGASAEVGGYLSVASKAAAFALLVRFLLAITGAGGGELASVNLYLGLALGALAAVTMTFGNLAAYGQTNVKRLLAYSTIAHAGYMLMAVSAMLVITNGAQSANWSTAQMHEGASRCIEGLTYYLAVYLFMNLAAFAIVALIRNETYTEEIEGYNGLSHHSGTMTVLCVCMAIAMFSLLGMPPFGGFFAKLLIFASVWNAGSIHWAMWGLVLIAGLNTVFSLFYYLRVLKAMFIAPRPEGVRTISISGMVGAYVVVITIPILLMGASPLQNNLSATAHYVASVLFP
ncbi:MAG: NADH-quinone oxidoreductase subunit N [Planctomycetaceae bacterium]|nr:NADH-quinone oxidoreductase subunit N [Planctomycetaceae bacterium]